MTFGDIVGTVADITWEFLNQHFWEVVMVIVMVCRSKLRWLGLLLIITLIMWGSAPTWMWIATTGIAIGIEFHSALTQNKQNRL